MAKEKTEKSTKVRCRNCGKPFGSGEICVNCGCTVRPVHVKT